MPASDTGALECAMWTMLGAAPDHRRGVGKLRQRVDPRRGQATQAAEPDHARRRLRRDPRPRRRSRRTTTSCSPGTAPPRAARSPNTDWLAAGRAGRDDQRRHQRDLRDGDGLGQARCDHLSLAEGDGLRSPAWHADPQPHGGRADRELRPAVAAAQAVPHQEEGPARPTAIFEGATINTPSMLATEDYIVALEWAKSIGGRQAMFERARPQRQDGVRLDRADARGSQHGRRRRPSAPTPACAWSSRATGTKSRAEDQADVAKKIAGTLEKMDIGYDFNGYRDAPPSLRIWCGGSVDRRTSSACCRGSSGPTSA